MLRVQLNQHSMRTCGRLSHASVPGPERDRVGKKVEQDLLMTQRMHAFGFQEHAVENIGLSFQGKDLSI